MKYNVPQRVIRDIIKTAEKHDIEKVILFGSRARGNHTERGYKRKCQLPTVY